jgi:hypothetical protein
VCTIDQTENLAHLGNLPFARYKAYDVDAAVQYRDAGNEALNAGAGAVNIQDRDDYRVFVRGTFYQFRDGIYGVTFDADKDNVCFALEFFCGRGFYL